MSILSQHRKVPETSGMWGFLLPRPGDKAVSHEPDSMGELKEINPAYLRLEPLERLGDRGAGLVIGTGIAVTMLVTLVPGYLDMLLDPNIRTFAVIEWIGLWAILAFVTLVPLTIAYLCARNPLPPPMIVSRRHRTIYAWENKQKKWIGLKYDTLVPATYRLRMFTMGGSHTVYRLFLCQLKPGSRDIEWALGLGMAGMGPEYAGALWEFIRRYMDGPPQALPPSRLLPPTDHPKSWMALTDRTALQSCIDEQYRVRPGFWGSYAAWFGGSIGYWTERAGSWIRRTAPRHPYAPEVQAAMQWEGENPYPILPPSEIDLLALEGKLPHMRRRWFICGVFSTLIFGFLFSSLPLRAYFGKEKAPQCIGVVGCEPIYKQDK